MRLGQNELPTGSVAVDPALLLWGVGLLALGMYFLGGRHEPQRKARRRSRRYRRAVRAAKRELGLLEA